MDRFTLPGLENLSTTSEDVVPRFALQEGLLAGTAATPFSMPTLATGEAIQIGMPHLALGGLSENWLLKECGHRHWTLLAAELGLPKPDFRDAEGNRLYAAFTVVRVCDAHPERAAESHELRLRASLDRISRTQWLSSHVAVCGDRVVAKVAMVSAFLRRTVTGSNRLVQRATAIATSLPSIKTATNGADLVENAHRLRTGNWQEHLGFDRAAGSELATFNFRPCPNNDFNGANFLYFASFQSIVDRAEWQWGLPGKTLTGTKHREIFYHGNIDVEDSLRIVLRTKCLRGGPPRGRTLWHWCQIFRLSDRKLIADVFTAKAPIARPSALRRK